MGKKQDVVAWEARWSTPVAVATFLAVALVVASALVGEVSGDGNAAILRSTHAHSGSVTFTGLLQAVGFALLSAPLLYLFRAVRARSPRVRSQLIGLVIAAPLLLALSTGLASGARKEAASQFVAGEAKSTLSPREANEKCVSERQSKGAKAFGEEHEAKRGETALAACEDRKIEDDEAENASREASLAPIASGLGIAGSLGFVFVLFYCGMWAMRTGVLTRFWASLGMAAGIAFLLGPLFFIALIWFIYFGLLLIDKVPGGRPPAWAAGEAIPWPTAGEKAAAELEPPDTGEPPAGGDGASGPDSGERRKRKQRD
ncbi:MAG: hypothetical protein U0R26_02200 [Solirubrobacterales bacterium]